MNNWVQKLRIREIWQILFAQNNWNLFAIVWDDVCLKALHLHYHLSVFQSWSEKSEIPLKKIWKKSSYENASFSRYSVSIFWENWVPPILIKFLRHLLNHLDLIKNFQRRPQRAIWLFFFKKKISLCSFLRFLFK